MDIKQSFSIPDQNEALRKEKKLNRIAWVISIAVLLVVVGMRRFKIDTAIDFSFLPPFHASVNGITFFVLMFALYQIKSGNISLHRKSIYLAMCLSVVFLISYVLYHITTPETKYCHEGNIRNVYFIILITHIILAGIILPFILFTFNRAYTGQYARHKKLARIVMPLWLYVCATGPICYLMLRDC